MKFNVYGEKSLPVVVLVHGGGLGAWSLEELSKSFLDKYCVVIATIEGHGNDASTNFTSIESSAEALISHINENFHKKVFLLYGLSLGAQIALEALCQREDLAEFAVLESALVYPLSSNTRKMLIPSIKLTYPLIQKKWFAKAQAKSLFIGEDLFEDYFQDSKKMSLESLINISVANANYSLPENAKSIQAKVLIVVGEKEIPIMRYSAKKLNETISQSSLYVVKGAKHGEFSLLTPKRAADVINNFTKKIEN